MSGSTVFDYERHVRYFGSCLCSLPEGYSKLDTNRLTLVHFAVHALDLLGVWDDNNNENTREAAEILVSMAVSKSKIIEWIYSLQSNAGFVGGSFLGEATSCYTEAKELKYPIHQGHIAMTYTALATLRTLGDDFSRVHCKEIIQGLGALQLDNGSFQCTIYDSEHDMRFLYCACCISHMLNDWSGVNTEKAADYIRQCRSFDGAIALLPGQEGHGGSTFCAVASLVLMEKLDDVLDEEWRRDLIQWCVRRQVGGMQGRPNKDQDTCYSYWIGGTLRLLGQDDLLDHERLRAFVMKCQTQMGGFSKTVGDFPDILHAFYSMAYLSISQTQVNDDSIRLKALNCTLGICEDRAALFQPVCP
jgi:geranylgeranyl transferase type-1 subunit beta